MNLFIIKYHVRFIYNESNSIYEGSDRMQSGINVAIHVHKVNYYAGEEHILKNITGSFHEGTITTIVGPSGAGKSTLLKLCNGLLSFQSGEIYIKNKRIEQYHPIELRRNVGLALQSAPMINGTVYDNMNLPLKLQGKKIDLNEAEKLLDLVVLDKQMMNKHVKDLSGGQRQKVSIARTLVNRPEILLLDEITSSLDPVSQKEIEDLIVKINQHYGVTIVWITHNLRQALEIGDYTWVMMNGELVETGESSLLNHPKNERVQQFVKGELS
jgi:putative ABC transport system ATP-binding protein